MSEARVLHVLPHRGGGGETYVEQLASMGGFEFDRVELTRRRNPLELAGGLARVIRAARSHDLVHVHGDAAALACLPAIGMRPTVITLHGSHLLRRTHGTRGRLVREGSRRAFARAAAVIAVSESELSLRPVDRAGGRWADHADSQRGPGCPTGVRRRPPCGAGDPCGRARFVRRSVRRRAQRAQAARAVRGGRRAGPGRAAPDRRGRRRRGTFARACWSRWRATG